jgi:shikimate dehydrogenase
MMRGPDGHTRLIGIIGDPTGHIRGFTEYAAALAARGANAAYLPFHVHPADFAAFVAGLRGLRNLAGLVATIPHKLAAFQVDEPDATARLAGSANMLRPTPTGWQAGNVDGPGFVLAARAAGMTIAGARVQLLGAGGAGRAVAMAIAAERPTALAIHDTDASRAENLARAVTKAFPDLATRVALEDSSLLVNASPVGMGSDARLPCPAALVPGPGGAVYDIVNRADTPLVVLARQKGAASDHGYSMMAAEIPLILDWMLGP